MKKDVDYDKKIQEKADFLGDDALNRYFFEIVVSTLEWTTTQHVTGYHIYQYNLNWQDKNMFRRGYLFLGNSADRPTAQPEEDFYVYILPPFGNEKPASPTLKDEVYFALQYDTKFSQLIRLYGGAREKEAISATGETRTVYAQRSKRYLTEIRKWLDENKTRMFRITYRGTEKPILEYLKGVRMNELMVKTAVDIAASRALGPYFAEKYPDYPRFQNPITEQNMGATRQEAANAILGRPTQLGTAILESLGLLLDGKIRPENSKYAAYYIQKLKNLPTGTVLNFSDIMETRNGEQYTDRHFHLDDIWMSVILTALVYGGHCVLIAGNGQRYDAGNMESLCKCNPLDIYGFKRLELPKTMNRQMLTRLFDAFDVSSGLLASESIYPQALETLHKAAQERGNAALKMADFLQKYVSVWGEMLIPMNVADKLRERIAAIHKTSDDVRSRFTTPAKLKNFDYDDARMKALEDGVEAMRAAQRARTFYDDTRDILDYITKAETRLPEDVALHDAFEEKKAALMALRDRVMDEDYDADETDDLIAQLVDLKNAYIAYYMDAHQQYRLDHAGATKKGKIQQSDTVKALNALRSIRDILPVSQLMDVLGQLAAIKPCYECTTPELQQSPDCPHCHFNPADNASKPVAGRLEYFEDRLDDMLSAWTKQLLSALDDPMLADQKALLSKSQQRVIDAFTQSKALPMPVTQEFIGAVNAMLEGMESVELPLDDLHKSMISWSPCEPGEFKNRLNEWVDQRIKGMDKSRVRIVIK